MESHSKHANPTPVDTGSSLLKKKKKKKKEDTGSSESFKEADDFVQFSMAFCSPEPDPGVSLVQQIAKQRDRLANVLDSGINHLLLAHTANLIIPPSHSLLCLQVVLGFGKEKVEGEYRDLAGSTVPHAEHPTYELDVEGATGLLLDYDDYWIHSLSMVLLDLNSWKDKISTCNLESRANNAAIEQSSHAEVTLFLLADYVIDDKVIGNREKLKEFLEELSQKKIEKVLVICSSGDYGKEEYSHVIV